MTSSAFASAPKTPMTPDDREEQKYISAAVLDRTHAGKGLQEDLQSFKPENKTGVAIATRQILNTTLAKEDPHFKSLPYKWEGFIQDFPPLLKLDAFEKAATQAVKEARAVALAFQAFNDALSPQQKNRPFWIRQWEFLLRNQAQGWALAQAAERSWAALEAEQKKAEALYPASNPAFDQALKAYHPMRQANVETYNKAILSFIPVKDRSPPKHGGGRGSGSYGSTPTSKNTTTTSSSWLLGWEDEEDERNLGFGDWEEDEDDGIEEKKGKDKDEKKPPESGALSGFVTQNDLSKAEEARRLADTRFYRAKQDQEFEAAQQFGDKIEDLKEDLKVLNKKITDEQTKIDQDLTGMQEAFEKVQESQETLKTLEAAKENTQKRYDDSYDPKRKMRNPNLKKQLEDLEAQIQNQIILLASLRADALTQKHQGLIEAKAQLDVQCKEKTQKIRQEIDALTKGKEEFIKKKAEEIGSLEANLKNAEQILENLQKTYEAQSEAARKLQARLDLLQKTRDNYRTTFLVLAHENPMVNDMGGNDDSLVEMYIELFGHADEVQLYLMNQHDLETAQKDLKRYPQAEQSGFSSGNADGLKDFGAYGGSKNTTTTTTSSPGGKVRFDVVAKKVQEFQEMNKTPAQKERDRIEKELNNLKETLSIQAEADGYEDLDSYLESEENEAIDNYQYLGTQRESLEQKIALELKNQTISNPLKNIKLMNYLAEQGLEGEEVKQHLKDLFGL